VAALAASAFRIRGIRVCLRRCYGTPVIHREEFMDKCFARRVHGPRLKPLASCLALALALSTGTVAASPARPLMDRPAISELLPNWKPSHTPIHRIEQNAANAMQYPALQPVPQRIPQVPAGSVPVTNCNDSGAGSLRDAISIATSGQTIDLTATGCS